MVRGLSQIELITSGASAPACAGVSGNRKRLVGHHNFLWFVFFFPSLGKLGR